MSIWMSQRQISSKKTVLDGDDVNMGDALVQNGPQNNDNRVAASKHVEDV